MQQPMQAISVTFCRDRGSKSEIAPLEPLPLEQWEQFQADVHAALELIPQLQKEEIEYRSGHTVYEGRLEPCLTLSQIWADPTPGHLDVLGATLSELSRRYDQEALVLHVEQRHLIRAAA